MTSCNPVQAKSYSFALEVIRICKVLMHQKEFVLSKQLLRSGTSIGANIQESVFAQSKKDFISKLAIALKEANESRYWLQPLHDSGYLVETEYEKLFSVNTEIIRILVKSLKTAKV